MEARARVLSGMRPAGRLHLGNFLGALEHLRPPFEQIREILAEGSARARWSVGETLAAAKSALGIV